jgi:hypothetical protein
MRRSWTGQAELDLEAPALQCMVLGLKTTSCPLSPGSSLGLATTHHPTLAISWGFLAPNSIYLPRTH